MKTFAFGKRAAILVTLLTFLGIALFRTDKPAPASSPYGPSPVISNIEWSPASTITRRAEGSDTWPITWGDDGNLYTAFGDGWGFEPRVPKKLSLGIAKVSGDAQHYEGINITSDAERFNHGPNGKKASGMLMVDGVLYMWVRNANEAGAHCELAWSYDRGKTWKWSSWEFTEFGYCTFINYGRDYFGARDDYIYTVSHDGSSAYQASDNMVLLRVHKETITDKESYEVFVRLDQDGDPVWSSKIGDRKPVFSHWGNSLRSGITYNPGLKRYLWWQQIPNASDDPDTRFEGGFGIYDAPEPWGPWTTAYFVERWDIGPGETASFPTKWMSPDGQVVHLLFSGDDSFSIRKATLVLHE